MADPAISVLLPSVRPGLLERAYASLEGAACDVSYEVVIVADFGPKDWPRCRWVVRDRRGSVDAVNRACQEARGEYWFLFNDESVLESVALEILYHEAVATPDQLLTPLHLPRYAFSYYGLPFPAFPFAHRDLFARLGGVLDPIYKAFYADPDLGMRAHAHGVPVVVAERAVIHHHNGQDDAKLQNMRRYFLADRVAFRERWDHLGEFRDC